MRTLLRSFALLAVTAASHCATPAPSFAQESAAAPGGSSGTVTAPAAPVPSSPAAPAPADATAPIEEAAREPETLTEHVDEWFRRHFHNLGPQLDTPLYNRLYAAMEDLKHRLAAAFPDV